MGRRAAAVVVEVIEVDDAPGHSPFGPASYGRHASDDPPGERPSAPVDGAGRWHANHVMLIGLGTVVAVIVLVALVAGGSSTAPPTAATILTVTTQRSRPAVTAVTAPSTPQDQASANGPPLAKLYLPDLPPPYEVISADQTYPYRGTPMVGVSQLWSDRDAGARAPRWLRIDAGGDAGSAEGSGTARLSTVNGVAVVSSNQYGGVSLVGPIAGGGATVTTSGLTFAETRAALDGAVFADDTVRFGPGALPAGFRMVATSQPSEGAQGAVIRPFDFATMTLA